MATAIAALTAACVEQSKGVYTQTWTATVSGVGNPFVGPYLDRLTIRMSGPTGGTSNIIIEGTNGQVVSTATWSTLESVSGLSLDLTTVTAEDVVSIWEAPFMIRPRFATVTSGKTLKVSMIARGPLRG